ncbi:MAG: hypothetical protein JRH01_02335 [Deltaproteobacteria bacterium]|nr:hypothetical protein [Deltaproteobacteria bacterium]MBW2396266.1 hypothetical protein [Deltaproteobacteria bacterium]
MFAAVEAYSRFGVHHTGKEPDRLTSDWQANHLVQLGFEVHRQEFGIEQFDAEEVSLVLEDGARIAAAPQYPVAISGGPLTARLAAANEAAADLDGAIAIVELETGNTIDLPDQMSALARVWERGAVAIVAICKHPSGRIQFGNVADDRERWRIPLALVGGADRERLLAAVGSRATFRLEGKHRSVVGQNVQGRLVRGDEWIVVSTPQSGWTTCAGERGPGIAYFRALAEWASVLEGGPSWLFTSNSGHEFHDLGARTAQQAGTLPLPGKTALWLHLGAGIAQRSWVEHDAGITLVDEKARTLLSCDWSDSFSMLRQFWGTRTFIVPHQLLKLGEMREIVSHGYETVLGLVSEQPYHHVPGDLPETTSPQILETMGRAILSAISGYVR